MTLIKKCDVKMYFATRQRKGLHLVSAEGGHGPAEMPEAGLPSVANEPVFAEDFSLEHSSAGGTLSAIVMVTAPGDSQTPETPGSHES
jgi:hypothetical protein